MSGYPTDWQDPNGETLRPHICSNQGKGLVQTCKQIFHTARLLPFKLNEFSLWSIKIIYASRAYFTLEQLRAINHVDLRDGSSVSPDLPTEEK
jgi:hypothetical protein